MKRFLILALLCLSGSCIPILAANNADRWSLLVIPSYSVSGGTASAHTEWVDDLEKYPGIRCTVAVSPADFEALTPKKKRIQRLVASGRLELALRAVGDPPFPLIYGLESVKMYFSSNTVFPAAKIAWPDDVMGRIVRGKMRFRLFWNEDPKGFVPGGGSLNIPVADFLAKQQFSWTVAGFPESEWPVSDFLIIGGTANGPGLSIYNAAPESRGVNTSVLPALELVSRMFDSIRRPGFGMPPVIVFDQAHSSVTLEGFFSAVEERGALAPDISMSLCSERRTSEKIPSSLQIVPYSWSWLQGCGNSAGPGLSVWMGGPVQNTAWKMLAQARAEIERYKNSGSASLEKLDEAMERAYEADSSEFFECLEKPALERAFRSKLSDIYSVLSLPIPEPVKRPMIDLSSVPAAGMLPAVQSTDSIPSPSISSDAVKAARCTVQDRIFMAEKDPGRGPSISRFAVIADSTVLNGDFVSFQFQAAGFDKLSTMEIYIDVNRRSGAGETALFAGSHASVPSADGWEFALVTQADSSGTLRSKLIRSNGFFQVYRAAPSVSITKNGTILSVKVPKSLLGENHLAWGYLVCLRRPEGGLYTDVLSSEDVVLPKYEAVKKTGENAVVRPALLRMMRPDSN